MYVVRHSERYKNLTKNNDHYLTECNSCGCIFVCLNHEFTTEKRLNGRSFARCPECDDAIDKNEMELFTTEDELEKLLNKYLKEEK